MADRKAAGECNRSQSAEGATATIGCVAFEKISSRSTVGHCPQSRTRAAGASSVEAQPAAEGLGVVEAEDLEQFGVGGVAVAGALIGGVVVVEEAVHARPRVRALVDCVNSMLSSSSPKVFVQFCEGFGSSTEVPRW